MPAFRQSTQGKNLNGTSASTAAFSSNNVAHNLLVVAVLWFERIVNSGSPNPTITVTDSAGNTYANAVDKFFFGGGCKVSVFYVLDCAGSANTITASSSSSGVIFVNAHEVAPDASQVWKFDQSGFGENTGTAEIVITGNSTQYSNDYTFLCCGVDNQSFLPVVAAPASGFTNRTYNPNSSAINTGATMTGGAPLFFYGTLSTWDGLNWGNIGEQVAFITSNIFTSIAVVANFASVVPSCDAPTASPVAGTYVGTQSVTLTQDQSKPMYYTTDGTTPTTSSTAYSGAISVTASERINVLAHDPSNVLADTIVGFNYTINATPPPNANIALTWIRRTRIGGEIDWVDGPFGVPLSEDTELYNVDVYNASSNTVVRSVTGLTSPAFNYTFEMQEADFVGIGFCYFIVYQISSQVGRGFPSKSGSFQVGA